MMGLSIAKKPETYSVFPLRLLKSPSAKNGLRRIRDVGGIMKEMPQANLLSLSIEIQY